MREFCGYSVETIFSEVPLTSALQGDDEDQVIIDSEEEGNIIVIDDDELRTIIDISLYKGDLEDLENRILLHNKTIVIDPPNAEGVEILNEDLVEGGE